MSDEEKPKESSASQLNLLPQSKTVSSDKLPFNPKFSESQPVIINFYSSSSQKSDKLVQTDLVSIKGEEHELQKYQDFLTGTNLSSSVSSFDNPEPEGADIIQKNSYALIADDTTETELMEHRKHVDKYAPVYKAQTDLERKKLEAELKAAEEIAKIRQAVIEKRLAFELAALNEDLNACQNGYKTAKASPAPPPEPSTEYSGMCKQPLMESGLAQEIENLDFQNRFISPRVCPPATSKKSCCRGPKMMSLGGIDGNVGRRTLRPNFLQDQPKSPNINSGETTPTISPILSDAKTELVSSVLSSIRSLNVTDQKLHLDKKFSGSVGIVNPSSTGTLAYRQPQEQRHDPRERQLSEQRYDLRERQLGEQRYDPPDRPQSRNEDRASLERHYRHEHEYSFPPEAHVKSPCFWRSVFGRMRFKRKPKTSQ